MICLIVNLNYDSTFTYEQLPPLREMDQYQLQVNIKATET
jgi:hypothetical protein